LLLSSEYLPCTVVMTFSMYSISLRLVSTQEPDEQCHQGRFHSYSRRRDSKCRQQKVQAEQQCGLNYRTRWSTSDTITG
jgi:hypothetical protein